MGPRDEAQTDQAYSQVGPRPWASVRGRRALLEPAAVARWSASGQTPRAVSNFLCRGRPGIWEACEGAAASHRQSST